MNLHIVLTVIVVILNQPAIFVKNSDISKDFHPIKKGAPSDTPFLQTSRLYILMNTLLTNIHWIETRHHVPPLSIHYETIFNFKTKSKTGSKVYKPY